MNDVNRRVLPGFRLSLGYTLAYLGVLVLVPLVACFLKAATLPFDRFWAAVSTDRAVAAYELTVGASLVSAAINVVVGLLVAWVLVRYEFPMKRVVDSLVDLPFALPTAVAGLVYSSLYVQSGWLGRFLVPLGIQAAYSRLAIVLVLVFVGFPFVVRTLEPVLERIDADVEEAAACLGASRLQTVTRVIFPSLYPALVTGFALSFARALGVVGVLIVIPLVDVFVEAFGRGFGAYWRTLTADEDTLAAIRLTMTVAPIAVVTNLIFGIAAAWAISRFRFPGRTLLTALIDLPFSVSPVVAGLIFVLIFGLQGYLGPWLRAHDWRIIFATPGLVLATTFVTFPFVARELIPVMEAIGADEEIAAVSLGASGWQLFRRVTLPNIKWGLVYGLILCNARAMGEFGAVYVVSGHIAGRTDTMPLRVEKLFQEYNTPGAFAVASLLASLALVTLAVKTALEWKTRRDLAEAARLRSEGEEP